MNLFKLHKFDQHFLELPLTELRTLIAIYGNKDQG